MGTPGGPKSKQVFSKLAEEVDSLGKRIEKYTQMEQDLRTLPLPRDDFARQLGNWVDHEAERFLPHLAERVTPLVDRPYFDPEQQKIRLLEGEDGEVPADQMQAMLCYLFRDQLKEAFQQSVAAMKWPGKVGPPLSRRDPMIANLRTKLEALQKREDELLSAAGGLLRMLEARDPTPEVRPEVRESVPEEVSVRTVSARADTPARGSGLNDEEQQLLEMLQGDNVLDLPIRRRTGTG